MRFTKTSLAGVALTTIASPVFAASGPFFSLGNTDFVVLLAFILFIAVLVYFKVPTTMGKMLDGRAEGIKTEIEEARKLREDAQTLLASYERRLAAAEEQIGSAEAAAIKEVRDQAIVIAIAVSREIIGKQMTAADANKLIDDGITQVDAKLH